MARGRSRRVAAGLLIVLAAALLAGCAGQYGAGGTEPADETIEIEDNAFSPEELAVTAGTTVAWRNTGGDTHTVTFTDAPVNATSGDLRPGDRFEFTPTQPGNYQYKCRYHADDGMIGLLSVRSA